VLVAPNGGDERVEFLADGQQVVVHGMHPETQRPYSWHGAALWDMPRHDLPGVTAETARDLVDAVVALLVERFGYRLKTPPRQTGAGRTNGPSDWPGVGDLLDHDKLTAWAMKLLMANMNDGAAVNLMRTQVASVEDGGDPERKRRKQSRLAEIPGMVSSARAKLDAEGNSGVIGQGRHVPLLLQRSEAPVWPTPDTSHAVLKLSEWLLRDIPAPDPLMGQWLTTTSRVLFYAPTGIGKTMFGEGLGMRAAAGLPFLKWSGHRPCRVLQVDGEMSSRLSKDRLVGEVRRLGHPPPDGFHMLSHEDVENFAPLNTPQGQEMVEGVIRQIGGVDLILFDDIMSLIGGDMKEEDGWAACFRGSSRLPSAALDRSGFTTPGTTRDTVTGRQPGCGRWTPSSGPRRLSARTPTSVSR